MQAVWISSLCSSTCPSLAGSLHGGGAKAEPAGQDQMQESKGKHRKTRTLRKEGHTTGQLGLSPSPLCTGALLFTLIDIRTSFSYTFDLEFHF